MAAASSHHPIDYVRANIDQLVHACTDVHTGLTRLFLGLPLSNQAVASLADETKKTALQLKFLVAIKRYMTEDGRAELLDAVNNRLVTQNGILMTGLAPPHHLFEALGPLHR